MYPADRICLYIINLWRNRVEPYNETPAGKYFTLTYGCQMNESDSERINGQLEEIGYQPASVMEDADIVILNTCSIRQNAEEKVYGKIGELKKLKQEKPHLLVGITGCMAQENKGRLIARMPVIDFVLGPYHIHDLKDVVSGEKKGRAPVVMTEMNPERVSDFSELKAARKSHVFAWVPIMQGCNKFCTYCIVPYVRGRQASRTVQDICGEVRKLAEEGYKEITLLGQNVNSYGLDFRNGTDFADLINSLSEIPGIERIRYMTSHPRDMTFRMVDAMAASPKVVRHMHLPVQHGSNEMLRKMNRGYTIERFFELLEYVREKMPDIAVTTDIITGFPGETENMHQETLSLLKKARFDSAYTFIYSPRTGTPAARMTDQVPEDIKKRRLQELMNTENSISLELNRAMEGHTFRVIAEGPTKNDPEHWFGRTSGNKMIIFPKDKKLEVGMTVSVHVDKAQTWILKGTLTE